MPIPQSDSASAVAIKHQIYQLRYQLRCEQPYIKDARRTEILKTQLEQVDLLILGIKRIEDLQIEKGLLF